MQEQYRAYLALLSSMREGLVQLTELAKKKLAVVRQDDLLGLDEVLKQEQALSLTFRGLEQKRDKIHKELGVGSCPLSGVPSLFPPDMRREAEQATKALQGQYEVYNTAAKAARTTIERNLREVESTIIAMGGRVPAQQTGYDQPRTVEPPPAMKTDFRA